MFLTKFKPYSLALFRVSIGISLLLLFIQYTPNWNDFFSRNGILSINNSDIEMCSGYNLSIFYWTESIIHVQYFLLIGIIFSISFTLGLFTRLSTLVLYILILSMVNRNPTISAGYEGVLRTLLFFSLFTPLNYYFSIDRFFKKQNKELPLIWPVRLMQIHFASIYVLTALYKLLADKAWLTGDAMYWILINNQWSVFPYPELLYKFDGLLSKILTYGTLLIELLFPLLVWFKKTVFPILFITLIFHIIIGICIPDVIIFSIVMISAFWLFVPDEVTRKMFRLNHE